LIPVGINAIILVYMQTKRVGFTIVELLIVIVVIGILAAITMVAFNGVQDRARAASVAAAVDAYAKGLEMYRIEAGTYPDTSELGSACLGTLEQYPAQGDLGEGVCYTDGLRETLVDESVNEALLTVLSDLPDGTMPVVRDAYDQAWRGLWYASDETSTSIAYMLKGDQDCPRGTKDNSQAGLTYCEYFISQ